MWVLHRRSQIYKAFKPGECIFSTFYSGLFWQSLQWLIYVSLHWAKGCLDRWWNIVTVCLSGVSGWDDHLNQWRERADGPSQRGRHHPLLWGPGQNRQAEQGRICSLVCLSWEIIVSCSWTSGLLVLGLLDLDWDLSKGPRFSGLWTRTGLYTHFPGSPECRQQIMNLPCLHNCARQFQ